MDIFKAAKQIATVLGTKLTDTEFEFKRAVAIAQHHDGVSGTEKQHVVDDYGVYIYDGINHGQKILSEAYKYGVR